VVIIAGSGMESLWKRLIYVMRIKAEIIYLVEKELSGLEDELVEIRSDF
jgi:hypothetical protein